ncbi:MAG: family 1 extracellular solute-binding protein [Bacilli bacterium]|nr:family 1 extracellular solute-binding protein [Bacilli bacterium]
MNDVAAITDTQPVTLKVYYSNVGFSQDDFKTFFADPVQQKFPNITLEFVPQTQGNDPQSLVSSGQFPDIVFTGTGGVYTFKDLGVLEDLTDRIKKNQVDLNKFDPTVIASIKSAGDKGQIYFLPFSGQRAALFYNKDIFDRFGVSYPKDGMTWDQVIELSKQLSKSDGGIQFSGLHSEPVHTLSGQIPLPYVDLNTNQAQFDNPGWKTMLETVQAMYNNDSDKTLGFSNRDMFLKNQNLAMIPDWVNDMLSSMGKVFANGKTFNWGVAQLPYFKDSPNNGRADGGQLLFVSSTSQHKDQAFQVINYLTSKDVQMKVAGLGRIPAVEDKDIQNHFGADLKFMQGENLQGIFKGSLAKFIPATKFDSNIVPIIDKAGDAVLKGTDVNTALRDAQDAANKAIQQQLAQQ